MGPSPPDPDAASPPGDHQRPRPWRQWRSGPPVQLSRLRDETRAGKLITMLQFGTLSDELTKRNMEMFASEVMPHLKN